MTFPFPVSTDPLLMSSGCQNNGHWGLLTGNDRTCGPICHETIHYQPYGEKRTVATLCAVSIPQPKLW